MKRSAWPKGLPKPMCGDKREDRAVLWRGTPQAVKPNKQAREKDREEGAFVG